MAIVCVGSVELDSVKTPSGEREEALGGAATYFSAAASLFTHVDVVAVVGEDFPQQHVDFLTSKGIGLEGLERRPGRTFRWTGEYGYDLNEAKTLKTELNVFESFHPKVPEPLRKSEWLFLGNIDPRLQLDVLNQIEKPRLVAADTMNYWITGSLEPLKKLLARIDLLFVNDSEARQLSGQTNIVKAALAIQALGPRIVCIKRGEYGAMLFLPREAGRMASRSSRFLRCPLPRSRTPPEPATASRAAFWEAWRRAVRSMPSPCGARRSWARCSRASRWSASVSSGWVP